ncbi:MAG: acetyl-CoA carboxylase biotin carboxyl carrier protein subunit [Ignavibacteria bacterium]|nr:acetyl-CoA carboxylase biotin carboxyl carrier protein subunit [Ignavibacteria bacterium]
MGKEKFFVKIDEKDFTCELGSNPHEVIVDNELYIFEQLKTLSPGVYSAKINNRVVTFEVRKKENGLTQISIDGYTFDTEVLDEKLLLLRSFAAKEEGEQKGQVKVRAPMPGLVVKVLVGEGAQVKKGDKVVIIEAMKMENALASPISGFVQKVFVQEGQTVEKDATLVEIVSQ